MKKNTREKLAIHRCLVELKGKLQEMENQIITCLTQHGLDTCSKGEIGEALGGQLDRLRDHKKRYRELVEKAKMAGVFFKP